jgi:hypothetical protein
MVTRNDLVGLHSLDATTVLECEILPDRAGSVTNERMRVCKISLTNNLCYQVVQCRLHAISMTPRHT